MTPLEFDPALVPDYLDCFKSDSLKADVMDELEHHYGEMDRDERNERLQRVRVIGEPNVFFDGDDDEIDDTDNWEEVKL
jgi:molybdopterin converting factor small subunit